MYRHIHARYQSFQHAWRGLYEAVKYHPNFRIHLTLAVIAFAGAAWLRFSRIEFIIVLFTVVLGLAAEMINTSLEAMTDLITKEWREEARIAKDISAGMMLLVAIGAATVAAILFIPPIYSILYK